MNVGDLVRYGSTTPENRTPIQKVVGTIIEDKRIVYCDGDWDYSMGHVTVLWSNGSTEDVVFASLEIISD